MPCYTVQTMSVSFKAQNEDMLVAALNGHQDTRTWSFRKVGKMIEVQTNNGSITLDLAAETASLRGQDTSKLQADLNELKRAYSMEAVKVIARRQHWTLKTQPANKMKGVLQRRN